MKLRRFVMVFLGLLACLFLACSDDTKPPPKGDGGPNVEASVSQEASVNEASNGHEIGPWDMTPAEYPIGGS